VRLGVAPAEQRRDRREGPQASGRNSPRNAQQGCRSRRSRAGTRRAATTSAAYGTFESPAGPPRQSTGRASASTAPAIAARRPGQVIAEARDRDDGPQLTEHREAPERRRAGAPTTLAERRHAQLERLRHGVVERRVVRRPVLHGVAPPQTRYEYASLPNGMP